MTPLEIAPVPVTILNVEPVGDSAPIARSNSGLSLSRSSAAYFFSSIGVANSLGSNSGIEASASTPPFDGSITTTAPASRLPTPLPHFASCAARFFSTIFCRRQSIVVTSVLPGTGSSGLSRRTSAPDALTSTCSPPARPCN